MLKDLILKNRSYRRFDNNRKLTKQEIMNLIDLARYAPSAGNRQAIRYAVSCDEETNRLLYDELHWAAYLKDWNGPEEKERPAGYIVMVQMPDLKTASPFDAGIAAQTILLGAVEQGLGGCILASINRQAIAQILHLPVEAEILMVIALGLPIETVVLEEMKPDETDIKYYRDEAQVHHVPKRRLDDILL